MILTDKQVLPDGVHNSTLENVRELFGGFQRSDRRSKLCAKLEEYLAELKKSGIFGFVIVDGSFIMACVDEPEDIDLVLVLGKNWDMSQDLKPFQYNLVSKKDVKRNYPFDIFPVCDGSDGESYWIDFFSKVNVKWYDEHGFPDGSTKGLVRIAI